MWCQLRWQPLGGFTGLELARGWLPCMAGRWCQLLTRCSTAIIDQSVRILLHMAFACGWGFSQRGSFSKKKEAEAARPVKTWTQKFQNITFTVSNFSELSVIGQLQLMGKKIVWPSQWAGSIHLGTKRINGMNVRKPFTSRARCWNSSSDWNRCGHCALSTGHRE